MKKLLLITLVGMSNIIAQPKLTSVEQFNDHYQNEIRKSVQSAKRLAKQHNNRTDPYQKFWNHQDYLDELTLRINSVNKAVRDHHWYNMPIYSVWDGGERFFITQAPNPHGKKVMRPRRQVRRG